MGAWEYFSASFDVKRLRDVGTPPAPHTGETTIEDLLGGYGELGWELVSMVVAPVAPAAVRAGKAHMEILYTFKRPKG